MATGLFDSPPSVAVRDTGPAPADEYRALAGVAIAAAALALLSPLAFIDWWLAVVPLFGLVLGAVALRDIAGRPAELTGRPPPRQPAGKPGTTRRWPDKSPR